MGRQLVSDVPLGAFFSGGLDSTAIVEYMRREMAPRKPTCYRRFLGARPFVRRQSWTTSTSRAAMPEGGGIRYREMMLDPGSRCAPSRSSGTWTNLSPTRLRSPPTDLRGARGVPRRAALGMGGDELFGGYPRYLDRSRSARRTVPLTRKLAPAGGNSTVMPVAGPGLSRSSGRRAEDLGSAGCALSRLTIWPSSPTSMTTPRRALYTDDFARGATVGMNAERVHRRHLAGAGARTGSTRRCTSTSRPSSPALNLVYVDKMSMAHSIEVRVPLLDERVVDVVRRVAPAGQCQRQADEDSFAEAMRGVVPDEIIDPAQGRFWCAARGWLANELSPLVDELLSPDTVRRRGIFRAASLSELISDFRRGRRDNALQIWQLLTLELWQQAFIDQRVGRLVGSGR